MNNRSISLDFLLYKNRIRKINNFVSIGLNYCLGMGKEVFLDFEVCRHVYRPGETESIPTNPKNPQ